MRMPRPNRLSRMSCSAIALATVMVVGASPAAAQSFQGEGVFAHGTGSIAVPDSTTTNISVTSGQAVIDWSPFDTEGASGTNIVFQPGGTTASFSSGSNFAVLNRINPADSSRAIGMDGAINSLVNGQTGGNVYFYSPSGFILGATSAINVGSLVLSASPLQLDVNGNFINGTSVQFNQAPNPNARVLTMPGSQVSALNQGSYVAMVAPRVQHHGTIAVNGSAALIGAEAATVNFSPDGLFDIQVTVGTTNSGGVAVHGDIGGPASTGGTDNHRVYMVAVPKNDALTMVIGAGSDLGFTLAGSAAIDDMGAVVLSAGHDVSGGGIAGESAAAGATANINFSGAHVTSNLLGEASGSADFFAGAGQTVIFDSDVDVHAVDRVWMSAFGSDASLTVTGNLNLSTNATGAGDGESVTGGQTALYAQTGGEVTVVGNAMLTADGRGGDAFESPAAGNGSGGQVLVQAEPGGTLSIGGTLDASADGIGGDAGNPTIDAGNGTGGNVFVGAFGTGSNLSVTGVTFATAEGHGGDGTGSSFECFDCNGAGGFGLGGTVSIGALADAGAVAEFGGSVDLSAGGFGGSAGGPSLGGNGSGGVAQADVGTNATLTVTGTLTLNADGQGGSGDSFGGIGDGGITNISSDFGPGGGSTFTVNGDTSVTADGYGGSAFGSGGNGGDAFGGDTFVGGDSNVFAFIGDLYVSASAYGGDVEIGTGGNATGGVAGIVSNGATIQVSNDASVLAEAYGGVGETGGAALGGFARFESEFNIGIGDSAFASASAFGGHGFNGDGGTGTGGGVSLFAQNGDLTFGGPLFVAANGTGGGSGGEAASSGDGFGGSVTIEAAAEGNLIVAGLLFADAIGRGGFTEFFGIHGGDGTGGTVNLLASGGNAVLNVGNSVFLSADGEAGSGGECFSCGGIGGNGFGGDVFVGANGVASIIDMAATLDVSAKGYGGVGVTGTAGNGTGGLANMNAGGGGTIILSQDLSMTAEGFGGAHVNGGIAGNGTGGTTEVITDGTTGALIDLENGVSFYADGFGGNSFSEGGGGTGGDGFGGLARILSLSGSINIAGSAIVSGSGEGGAANGGTGGDGFGKQAVIRTFGGDIMIGGFAIVDVSGIGGNGNTGGSGTGGGDPVESLHGARILAGNGSITIGGSAFVSSVGSGGNGDNGGNGGDGTGGWAFIFAANSDLGPSSISIQGVESGAFVSADGYGGFGGDGVNGFSGFGSAPGEAGGNGGAGGAGTGGVASITAWAGNGHVTIDFASATAFGRGGDGGTGGFGGAGGNAEIGAGGNGGAGGTGGAGGASTGGRVTVGTQSGDSEATASNLGTGTYGTIYADASALGGSGGSGGAGGGGGFGSPGGTSGANGNGGAGGIANGGTATLLVRGSLVEAGDVDLYADGWGGSGGSGGQAGVMGAGGDGIAGSVGVLATSRFLIPGQRGTLNAGAILGSAEGLGGFGSIAGNSIVAGGSFFEIEGADATLGSVDILVSGSTVSPDSVESRITVINGAVNVAGDFNFSTIGDLSVHLSNSSLTADNVNLTAANFVPDTVNAEPGFPGTIFGNSVAISTGNNFYADANLDAVNDLVIIAPGSIQFDQAISDGSVDLWAQGGSIAIEGVDAGAAVSLLASGTVGTDDILAGTTVDIEAQDGSIGTGHVNAGGNVFLLADTFIEGDNIVAGGNIFAQTLNGGIDLGNLTSTFGSIELDAAGDVNLGGNMLADGDIEILASGLIDINHATAGESIGLEAGGNVTALNLTAGDSLELEADGSVNVGNLSAGLVNASTSEGADYAVTILAGGNVVAGNLAAAQNIGLAALGTMTTDDINAGGIFMALGHGNMSFGDATASEVFLADFAMTAPGGGNITGTCLGTCGTLGANGVVTAPPTGSSYSYVTTEGGVDGAGQIPGEGGTNGSLFTTSAFNAAAGDDLSFWFNYVTSDGSGFADYAWAALLTASLDPVATLFTARTQPSGTIVPGQNLPGVEATLNPASVPIIPGAPEWSPLGTDSGACFDAGCGFTGWISSTYDIADAGSYVVGFGVTNWSDTGFQSGMAFSGITIAGVPVETGPIRTGGSISIGNVDTGKFTAAAGTSLTTGIIDSGGAISLDAGGAITTGNLLAGDFVLANGGAITTGNIEAGSVDMTSTGGIIVTGDIFAFGDVALDAFGDISFASANSGGEFDFSAGGSVNGGNVVAGLTIEGEAGGTVNLGNVSAGFNPGESIDDDTFSVGIQAAGSITAGNVQGAERVGFATLGNLTTQSIQTGWDFLALVEGNITTGAITTSGEGQVYLADSSMFLTGGGTLDGEGDFDPNVVLALDPVATGGSITINGPVSTGLFRAAAGTGFAAQAITAGDIHVSAGATATVNGAWTASDVEVTSNDIDITGNGSIDASDILALISTNATQALIGDGLTGSGYALTNTEFGRLEGGSVYILARGDASAAQDMLIGDLTVTGPSAGSTIEASEGILVFATGDVESETPSGVIRVVGDVAATGFGSANAMEFHSGRFDLDAATGSIVINSSGTTLGGELGIYADQIHVASGALLDQLAANPQFSGYIQALNDPAEVERPEGVLNAATIWIESDDLQSILIQNTGTAQTPAGFLANEIFVNDDFDIAGPPGSIDVVANGQLITESGTLTGVAVRDALVEGEDLSPFTETSTINGCLLTGSCFDQPPPIPDVVDSQIDLIGLDYLGDGEFGNELEIDDGDESNEDSDSPISPPHPLFDTRPLVPGGDVNDPVSGTGNPALVGGAEQECETDEQGQCPTQSDQEKKGGQQ